MPWVSRLLRGDRVWVRASAAGEPTQGADGRVDVLYKKGGRVYRASSKNLGVDPAEELWSDGEATPQAFDAAAAALKATPVGPLPADAFMVWADGACTGNPGPAGLGVVMLDGARREELSEYLGDGTNNIAELTAIVRALELAPRDRTVVIHSDSAYALGLLGKGWKAKANQDLVAKMRALATGFKDLRLVKVAGHSGVVENERADELAREAVQTRETRNSKGAPLRRAVVEEKPLPRPRKNDTLF